MMRGWMNLVTIAAFGVLTFAGAGAYADDKVAITVTNDNNDDVIVSLFDMNTTPRTKLLSHQRINGFASIPIAVTADANGNGHVYWKARSAGGSDTPKCGAKDKPGLSTDASVHVYAKSDCRSK